MVTHWICQSSYGIIQDEQILVLVLPESKDQSVQNVTQIWHQLCACLFLQGCKCTEKKQDDEGQCWIYTHSLVVQEYHKQDVDQSTIWEQSVSL